MNPLPAQPRVPDDVKVKIELPPPAGPSTPRRSARLAAALGGTPRT